MKEVKLDSWKFIGEIEWTCPICKKHHKEQYPVNPYRSIADDAGDVYCNQCKEFFTVSFYE